MEGKSSSSSSQDSLASLTAGDVLICSTGVHRERSVETVTGAGGSKKKVTIAVKKLHEAASPNQAAPAALAGDKAPCVTPAVLVSSQGAPPGSSCSVAPGAGFTMDDVSISQYGTGRREALRAMLKQKTQNTLVQKEVKVHLLGNASTEKKESVGEDTKSAHREADSATTIAAATAAAIATTAPLLKVQNDLEAKVKSVSALLSKLQETDRRLQQRIAEHQTNTKTLHEKPHCHERVSELEKQMNAFMMQRIQHLEKLQEEQMNIQSRLLSSAVSTGGLQQVHVPSSGLMTQQSDKPEQQLLPNEVSSCRGRLFPTSGPLARACSNQFQSCGVHTRESPLQIPVPRRCAPEPVSKSVKISKTENPVTEKENIPKSTSEGEGRLLERTLCSQEMPLRQSEPSKKAALNSDKMSGHSEKVRHTALQTDLFPAFESSFQNYNSIEKTVKKADDLLQDLGQLRREMRDMLQEASSWKSGMIDLKSKPPAVASDLSAHHQLNKPSILQNVQVPTSSLRNAERILRGVQNNRKVLEENLEAVIRMRDGDSMYTFIDALATNRDGLEEIRIKKTVDEWIKAISVEIQAEMARNDSEQVKYDQKVPWIKRAQNIKALKTNKEIKVKTQKIQGCLTKKPLSAAKPVQKQAEDNANKQRFRTYFSSASLQGKEKRADGPVSGSAVVQNEDYLYQVYGKPVYQGHRSTLKKAPYLRFNSPSLKPKLQRPKVVECVRGTKVKSAGTQTCSRTQKVVTSPKNQNRLYALSQENQYFFSPSRDVPAVCGPVEGHLIPMAIPLGQTQISDISLQPAGVVIGKPHPITVTTSLPQAPPKPPVEIKKPNIAVIEMKSEKKDPPQLSVQVLPSIDINSVSDDSVSVNHVLPGSEPALPPVDAVIQTPEDVCSEEEDTKFPGTNFVEVTDVMEVIKRKGHLCHVNDQEEEKDEIRECFESPVELTGQFKVASPKYNGPLFPPVASAPQQSSDVLDELIQRRETIENKLINWVEQEIMARIISEMYPLQKETVPNVSTSESDDSETVASDIVEVAGGEGFQLFVDAGVPVDSEMISRLVNEALHEIIATMLGSRQAEIAVPATNDLPSTMIMTESLVPTPLPTPQATPPQTPPSEKELPPVKTPESSLSLIEMSGDVHEHEKIKETGVDVPAVTSCVATPVVTPVNTPPRTTTPSPPVCKAAKTPSPKPPNPWDGAELPLDEEKPSSLIEEPFRSCAFEMSVAKDEEPEDLVLPSRHLAVRPSESLPCEPQVPSPVPTVSSGQSTQESSLTLTETETETVDRPISEGEVLFSYGQVPAAIALAGGLSLPNLAESLTNTLQDADEMDYDPPSEGQVVRRLDKVYHRDPVITLLDKLNQAPVAVQERMYHLEDSDDNAGELSEGQRPRLTRAEERILMGHSVYMDHPSAQTSGNRRHQFFRSSSPGQVAPVGAEILGDADTSPGPMHMAQLEMQPVSDIVLQAAQPSCRGTSLCEDLSQEESRGAARAETVRPRVIHVRKKSEEMQRVGEDAAPQLDSHVSAAKLLVKLPSMNTDSQSTSSLHDNSDSSGTDTF
ncbi:protein TALPID3 isoform X4 [Phaenicophaeus curvirostris]|uniref:protein TALPID3 isoform X4 n=1 Tax=Phaenicophaeus curvirostris TaxID=33595 RepID=UPI0037F0C916